MRGGGGSQAKPAVGGGGPLAWPPLFLLFFSGAAVALSPFPPPPPPPPPRSRLGPMLFRPSSSARPFGPSFPFSSISLYKGDRGRKRERGFMAGWGPFSHANDKSLMIHLLPPSSPSRHGDMLFQHCRPPLYHKSVTPSFFQPTASRFPRMRRWRSTIRRPTRGGRSYWWVNERITNMCTCRIRLTWRPDGRHIF